MAYIADLDPNRLSADEVLLDYWDYMVPDWYTMGTDPEHRDTVDYADVENPETGLVWGYGGDHRVYIPGAHE